MLPLPQVMKDRLLFKSLEIESMDATAARNTLSSMRIPHFDLLKRLFNIFIVEVVQYGPAPSC